MHNLTVGVFEHLDITSPMDVDNSLAYTQRILRGFALKKYQEVLVTCRLLAEEFAGDEWTLVKLNGLSAEDFCNWAKTDTMGYDGHDYLNMDQCFYFNRELWFELGKCMWRKHRSVYQYHINYVRNDIVKLFKVKILRYTECAREIHDLAKYLPPYLIKGVSAEADNLAVLNQEFTAGELRISIKDGIPKSMQDGLDDHP